MFTRTRKVAGGIALMGLATFLFAVCIGSVANAADPAHGAEAEKPALTQEESELGSFALMAAAIAFAGGAIGAGYAIAHVGAAAMGAVAEKPELAGQALIFIALAEGLVVFGFITALMIFGKV
ncbi:MAG: ATP synthase subunit C [Planctomycetota bacterium]|jgi:V/A-type H+-transporting ATPase subunit K